MHAIVAYVLSSPPARSYGQQHEFVRQAKLILEDQNGDPPVIEEIAASLGLSRLQHLFKEFTGISPYQYHLQLKIQRGCSLLQGSDVPVKQVARLLGFQSVYHFSTLFRKKTGSSPSQWRERGRLGGGPPKAAQRHRGKAFKWTRS